MKNKLSIFYILFALSFFLCHTGVCSTADAYFAKNDSPKSGCHEVAKSHTDHDNNKATNHFLETNYEAKMCCLDTVSNNKDKLNSTDLTQTLTILYSLSKPEIKGTKEFKLIQYHNKGHTPPDLIIKKSSFLI